MKTLPRRKNHNKISLVLLAYVAFIALGMPDGLLGVAWPTMHLDFEVPLDAMGLLIIASSSAYIASSFLSGALIAKLGVGRLLTLSCFATGLALFGYTIVPVWGMVVMLGLLAGWGAGAIDAGLNTYAAAHFGEGLMQWLHASFGIGITIGPIIMTMAVTSLESWRIGYWIVGSFQLIMAATFFLTTTWWNQPVENAKPEAEKKLTEYQTPMTATLRRPTVWLSALLFLLYVGAEISLGAWVYTLLTESRGMDPQVAGFWTSFYWGSFTIGRIVAGLYAKKLGVNMLVQGGSTIALLGSLLLWWNPFPVANLIAIGMIGLAIAPVFPAMMSGTSARVGAEYASNTIGMQIAAAGIGAASIVSLAGVLAERVSLESIPVLLVLIYLSLLGAYRLALYLSVK